MYCGRSLPGSKDFLNLVQLEENFLPDFCNNISLFSPPTSAIQSEGYSCLPVGFSTLNLKPVQILRGLRHENIIEMLDAFETPHEFCVVMEFAQGELYEILEDDQSLPEAQVQDIAKQLVSRSLHFFHTL